MQYEKQHEEQVTQQEETNNNRVHLTGKVLTKPVISHEAHQEDFYEITLAVERLSGMCDNIPVTIPLSAIEDINNITVGSNIAVKGQFRSYNKIIGDKSKLMLTVFAHEVFDITEPSCNPNEIELTGYVCKPPIYRTTPFNREIADILIAVNRTFNKSDYIPVIAWGKNARFAKNLLVGDKINIVGRIQSREYQKRMEDGCIETRVAYEISINRLIRDAE